MIQVMNYRIVEVMHEHLHHVMFFIINFGILNLNVSKRKFHLFYARYLVFIPVVFFLCGICPMFFRLIFDDMERNHLRKNLRNNLFFKNSNYFQIAFFLIYDFCKKNTYSQKLRGLTSTTHHGNIKLQNHNKNLNIRYPQLKRGSLYNSHSFVLSRERLPTPPQLHYHRLAQHQLYTPCVPFTSASDDFCSPSCTLSPPGGNTPLKSFASP